MINGHWTDKQVAEFMEFCKRKGAQVLSAHRLPKGDVEFSINCPSTTAPKSLISQFEREYKA